MPNWIIIATLVALALLLTLGLFLLARQRKRERLELRLASGRRQLLGRELESYCAELDALDEDHIAAKRQEAESALDQLHIALVERQAHLLNYEDMVHLQQCKIELLTKAGLPSPKDQPEDLIEDLPEDQPPPADTAPQRPDTAKQKPRMDKAPPAEANREAGRDRSSLESDLLDKINQLQGGKKPKK